MKKKAISRIGMLLLALIFVLSFAACNNSTTSSAGSTSSGTTSSTSVETPDPIVISYASNDAPGSLRYDMYEQKFADLMSEKTNGLITVEIYPSGALSKPGALLDALKNGTVDTGQDSYTRYAGQYPLYELMTAPGWRFDTFEDFTAAANEFVKQFPDESMKDFKVISIVDAGQFGLVSTTPISKIADIKGKSIRNTAQFIPLFDKLGASSVDVSSGELYEALRLNTISAVNTNNHAIPTFHLDEVCKSFTALPIEHTDVGIFMSQDFYDSLSPELQKAVDEVCAEMYQVGLDYIHTATDDAVTATNAANPEFQWLEFSDEDLASMSETALTILEAKAKELDAQGLPGTDAFNWIKDHQSK